MADRVTKNIKKINKKWDDPKKDAEPALQAHMSMQPGKDQFLAKEWVPAVMADHGMLPITGEGTFCAPWLMGGQKMAVRIADTNNPWSGFGRLLIGISGITIFCVVPMEAAKQTQCDICTFMLMITDLPGPDAKATRARARGRAGPHARGGRPT